MQTAETGSDPHATSAPGPAPGARIRLLRSRSRSGRGDRTGFPFALAICLLLVVATVSWRQKVFFDGGLDPVVVGKALLTCLALLLCLHAGLTCGKPNPIGSRTAILLLLFVTVSTFGGWAGGSGTASVILAVRVLLVGAAVLLLIRSFPVDVVLRAQFTAMAAVGVLAVITGVLRLSSTAGRLQGGFPPLAANEIALLCGAPALALIWRQLSHRGRGWDLPLIAVLVGAVWASQSRTGLAALLVAALLMVLQARRMAPIAVAAVVGAAAAAAYLLLTTDLVSAYFGRSNQGSVATLNSRTIAWSAALDLPQNPVAALMGGGLALKQIPVQGQYWNVQGLDSSWVSAWVQCGAIGLALLAIWAGSALIAGWRTPRPYRMIVTGMLLFLIVRSVTESGLIDATPSFLLFMTMSVLAEAGSRPTLVVAAGRWTVPEPEPPPGRHRDLPRTQRQLLRR